MVKSASLGSLSESSDDSGTVPGSRPSASGELVDSSLVEDALLSLSGVLSDDLGTSDDESSPSVGSLSSLGKDSAVNGLSVSSLVDSAGLSASLE